ncbi:MAG: response regulator transcription factor [Bacteroidetes bacterium]|nr:response regulator transcription factor [Bacteroidota bacterium]HET6244318.1 response regulator transcription factor [Bacteroidia bacterium]
MSLKRRISVFYIEDSTISSVITDHKLREIADFRIYPYCSAEVAFKDLYFNPDVIILDYILPGMNGLQAIQKFKQTYPEIPIIMLSGQQNIDVIIDVMRAGACEYMSKKNFSARELYEKICSIYDQKQHEKKKHLLEMAIKKILFLSFFILLFSVIVWYKLK